MLRRLAIAALTLSAPGALASDTALRAFSENCFSPFMTAARADAVLPERHDFYDLRPFRPSNPVSPPEGRAATPGTDRRCEVAFDGRDVEAGMAAVAEALAREGIATEAAVPAGFPLIAGTEFAAARQLNPRRIAVVQVGTRPGPNGPETFLNVERLDPLP
ncbi:MAG: succinyl-CoA synthetase subunit beta [Pseudomonadota bacterium]